MTDSPDGDHRPPMSERRHRLLLAALVLVSGTALYAGVRATETGDGSPVATSGRSEVVERLIPGEGDQVIRQAELGIDLAPGYEGALALNGVEIPTRELRLVPAQNEVFYTPGEGKTVERLRAGRNCAVARVWKSSEGRGTNDRTITWCFAAL